jgi:hypothetical protein
VYRRCVVRLAGRPRSVLIGLIVAILAAAGCDATTIDNSNTGDPMPLRARNTTVISYAGASSRLAGLSRAEVDNQLRDWARVGLASLLGLSTEEARDAFYDSSPVRDLGFADLVRQPTGPGRSLLRGDVLHVLVPRQDPHPARTVGLTIDQSRVDAGEQPQQVQVHRYEFDHHRRTIRLDTSVPRTLGEIRAANGYVRMRVDGAVGLRDFLSHTTHLSGLERRGAEIYANGWNWPDVRSAPLDDNDLAVLRRMFTVGRTSQLAFSLDLGNPPTGDELRKIVPELATRWTNQLTAFLRDPTAEPPDELNRKVEDALYGRVKPEVLAAEGLPSSRTHLLALSAALERRPIYQTARYDGDFAGTELGNTLFYVDHTAKMWVTGVGDGAPTGEVPGFVAQPDAETPLGHCPKGAAKSESGRLWFDQDDRGFDIAETELSIGAQVTRLFSRSFGANDTETEPSFAFGQALNWWDRNYQAIADYEPQYQRLEQIMRWSGALDWLAASGASLPTGDRSTPPAVRFRDWYAQHKSELRENAPIEFVTPRSAGRAESILPEPSKPFASCGYQYVTGGVSFGDLMKRRGDTDYRLKASGPVRRAGPFHPSSHLDPRTGAAQLDEIAFNQIKDPGSDKVHIERVTSVRRTIAPARDSTVEIRTTGPGRAASSLGKVKISSLRELTNRIVARAGRVSQTIKVERRELGTLDAGRAADVVMIRWRPGLLGRAVRALESVQRAHASKGRPDPVDGVLYGVETARGDVSYKVGGPDEPWLTITDDVPAPGRDISFRLGAPGLRGQPHHIYRAHLARGPPAALTGTLTVEPATATSSARLIPGAVQPDGPIVQVRTLDGPATLHLRSDGRPWVPSTDPILGVNGSVVGAAMLRTWDGISTAMRDAQQAGDRLWRAVELGDDGVAFVGDLRIELRPAGDPWTEQARLAMQADRSRTPLMLIDGPILRHVEPDPVMPSRGSPVQRTLEEVIMSDRVVYADDGLRSQLATENGVPVADRPEGELLVVVREATVPHAAEATLPASLPQIVFLGTREHPASGSVAVEHRFVRLRVIHSGRWVTGVDGGGENGGEGQHGPGGGGNPSGPATPASSSTTPGPAPSRSFPDVEVDAASGKVFLVCLDDGRGSPCEA